MPSVPVPSSNLVVSWQDSLEQQVQKGDLTDTMRKTYEWGFAQFLDWLEHTGAVSVTAPTIQDWLSGLHDQGHNSFSVSFWLGCVQNFFHWAYSVGSISNDPTAGIKVGLDEISNRTV